MSTTIGINMTLSIDIDELREQALTVTHAASRQILTNDDVEYLSGVISILDDILEKCTTVIQSRDSEVGHGY